ncbi:MAG: hypothetical protein BWY04_01503 [candidate division CPR1 bacterium ADurb.Bin160]|uniref:Uncharacterized protein n=1 Tax=candidate division CPR1 bacterium ADurb.Bin160 TaxID=1852826 RepID=A0A1V5ZIF2_9BACT|nr:MAG: hypothetical protein BWY04_01503 [candidate division CPR1 bacterium ADurb.Bin160]
MKKNMKNIFIFFISIFYILNLNAKTDTITNVRATNLHLMNSKTFIFDLYIERLSDKWLKFANGTFTFSFDESFDHTNLDVNVIKTELKREVNTGEPDIPLHGYQFDIYKYKDYFTIAILGPNKYEDCDVVSFNKHLLIGKFQITSKKNVLFNYNLKWKKPYNFYQACAYKLQNDSMIKNLIFYNANDNVEMDDGSLITYNLLIDSLYNVEKRDVVFNTEYKGRKKVDYFWKIKNEYGLIGYSVFKTIELPDKNIKLDDELIATWKQGEFFNSEFISKGEYFKTLNYGRFEDEILFRGGNYIYSLFGTTIDENGNETDLFLDSSSVKIPRAVIVKANVLKNPFVDQTKIEFILDDDCYVKAELYDLLGRFVKNLDNNDGREINMLEMKKGLHIANLNIPKTSSQGIFVVILTAYPILDSTVEKSYAVIKVQMIR